MTYKQYKKVFDKEIVRHAKRLNELKAIREQIQEKCKHKHTEYCYDGPYSDPYTECFDCGKIM